jgi:putative transposase
MNWLFQPWQLLLVFLSSWVNRQQQEVIEYLRAENQVLKEKLGKGRLLLNDAQRRRLAIKGKILGRKTLDEIATLVAADTILRWHRELVLNKWDRSCRSQRKPGRRPTAAKVRQLVVRMASENPSWGYDRISGALANLGHCLSASSVGNILRGHGIEPAPQRKQQTSWKTFLKAHWEVLAPINFTKIQVWTGEGLIAFQLLFAIRAATRREPCCFVRRDETWMKQMIRNPSAALS